MNTEISKRNDSEVPDSSGIQIFIPDPKKLYKNVCFRAAEMKYMSPEQRLDSRLRDVGTGFMSWTTHIDDELLQKFSISVDWFLNKGKNTSFIELSSSFWTSHVMDSWYIADKAYEIEKLLSKNDMFTSTGIYVTETHNIFLSCRNLGSMRLELGYSDIQLAKQELGVTETEMFGNNPFELIPVKTSIDVDDEEIFYNQLKMFQVVVPIVVSSFYEVLELKVPQKTMILSLNTSGRT
jgi:hypothetical protein